MGQVTTYLNEAFSYLDRQRLAINSYANVLGISATALAGATAKERDAYARHPDRNYYFDQYAKIMLPTHSNIEQFYAVVRALGIDDTPVSVLQKTKFPVLIDVGFANLKFATALRLLEKYNVKERDVVSIHAFLLTNAFPFSTHTPCNDKPVSTSRRPAPHYGAGGSISLPSSRTLGTRPAFWHASAKPSVGDKAPSMPGSSCACALQERCSRACAHYAAFYRAVPAKGGLSAGIVILLPSPRRSAHCA